MDAALREESALLPVRFQAGATSYTTRIAVDSHTEMQLMLYTPSSGAYDLSVTVFFLGGTSNPLPDGLP